MGLYLKKQKRFLKKLFVGLSLFAVGALFFFITSAIIKQFRPSIPNLQPLTTLLLMCLVFMTAYKPLDRLFSHLFKHYLFKQKSYAHITLMNLAEELAVVLDLSELSNLIVNTFGEVLQLKTVALLVPSRVREDFEVISGYGWSVSDAKRVRFPADADLLKLIRSNGPHVLVRDRVIRALVWHDANKIAKDFDQLRASWVVPLFVKDEFVGALGFATHKPEFIFDEADFQFFREFARTTAKYLRNALSVQELRSANEQLQDLQSQLLQTTKLNAIEQLATGIAHEIHNPLTIISGKAQVLLLQKDRNRIDERVEEVLKTIVKQTKRAADITRKLLMFSQSSGSPKEALHLKQVLEDTLALVSYQTSLEGIEITKSAAGVIPPFYGNMHELREVFLNLILNAVQSVGSCGKIHCDIQYRAADQIIEILISDTGRGIPPENVDKLFNPFFTTRTDAVGLGLFITKQIVHRYGGSVRVESRAGEGSLFIVQLPYLEAPMIGEQEASLSLFPNA